MQNGKPSGVAFMRFKRRHLEISNIPALIYAAKKCEAIHLHNISRYYYHYFLCISLGQYGRPVSLRHDEDIRAGWGPRGKVEWSFGIVFWRRGVVFDSRATRSNFGCQIFPALLRAMIMTGRNLHSTRGSLNNLYRILE